ncbi:hypothetical protein [Mumia sp. DW29H23]|uniref:hypothetical protein n=1 Tax=Mumia sp. DW29H23 TaxID=3421241 RepID=UPI003D6965B5
MIDQVEDADEAQDEDEAAAPPEGEAAPLSGDAARRTPWWRRYALPAVAALVLVVGVFLWWRAATDDQLSLADTRDEVLIAATQNIETMNTLDYREVDAGLAAWMDVTTGTLHDQLAQVGDDERQLLADQKKISTGKVVDAAVFAVDEEKATVVASVEVTVQDDAKPDEEPSLKRNRFTADLVNVDGEWLLESLEQVAVNIS